MTVKTIGHEKIRVLICLTAEADGTSLPPFIVFKSAKQEISALDKEIKNCCIASSPYTWMNTELTYICMISFRRRSLIWDLCECHIEDNVKYSLYTKKLMFQLFPEGAQNIYKLGT